MESLTCDVALAYMFEDDWDPLDGGVAFLRLCEAAFVGSADNAACVALMLRQIASTRIQMNGFTPLAMVRPSSLPSSLPPSFSSLSSPLCRPVWRNNTLQDSRVL